MVAIIHNGSSLRSALHYNENKLKEGAASFLDAGYYLENPGQLTFHSKLSRLASRNALNRQVKVNTLHVSLNFSPNERLSARQLKEIAASYLDKIGFAKQPYLLYEHHDSGHPHVHLITTTIRADGSSINLHNIGKNQSEKARKQIEIDFGLVKAQDQKRSDLNIKPPDLKAALYGKMQTRKAIANVLHGVLNQYKYCSLPELNAVLKQYNVAADRGGEQSRIYQNNGLVYRLLDEQGQKAGVPIKASDFYFKPTLKYLQARFAVNEPERLKHRARLKNLIDFALLNQHHSLESLEKSLEKQGVKMIVRASDRGLVYGLTYVDLKTKCVFNGSVLGKTYSAKGMMERCQDDKQYPAVSRPAAKAIPRQPEPKHKSNQNLNNTAEPSNPRSFEGADRMLSDLFSPENGFEQVPWQLKKSRKNKRRRGRS